MEGAISVLTVDDHPVFATALRARLAAERDIHPVQVAYNSAEAMLRMQSSVVHVAILDYVLSDGTGAALAAQIREVSPDTSIVMLSAVDSVDAVIDALAVGASAWLSKTVDTAQLARVVRRVHAGEMWLHPRTLALVLPRLLDMAFAPRDDTLSVLTAREREILEYLGEALDRREIAAKLDISENTVRTHVQNLLGKLGVHSSVEAVSILLRTRDERR
jgi:DNA-binding NarL/FixJ family response regulator